MTKKPPKTDRRGIPNHSNRNAPHFVVSIIRTDGNFPIAVRETEGNPPRCIGPVYLFVTPGRTKAQARTLRADYAKRGGKPIPVTVRGRDGKIKTARALRLHETAISFCIVAGVSDGQRLIRTE